MNRGDLPSSDYGKASQREDIFRDDEDRQRFLSALGEACGKTEWPVHAYCLMRKRGKATMSLKWIAQRLNMGSWTYVSNLLNELPHTAPQGQEVLPLCQ